jgi:hypothetical protein
MAGFFMDKNPVFVCFNERKPPKQALRHLLGLKQLKNKKTEPLARFKIYLNLLVFFLY